PRQICEQSTRSADARPQTSPTATDPRSEAKDTRVAERAAEVSKSTTPARAEAQCNVDLCAAKYGSFHAADCTYQPHGGGPRQICEKYTLPFPPGAESGLSCRGASSVRGDRRIAERVAAVPE